MKILFSNEPSAFKNKVGDSGKLPSTSKDETILYEAAQSLGLNKCTHNLGHPKEADEGSQQTLRYVNEGYSQDGRPHGKGKLTNLNGDIYEGCSQDGRPHGEGKLTYLNGDVYEVTL